MLTGPLANLAHALAADGQFVEAEQLFLRVIELEEDTTSTSPVERAETLNLYGNLLVRMNRLADAEAAQRRALQVLPEHERGDSYWRILNDLASTVSRQERIREALPLFRAALAGLDGRSDGLIVRRNLGVTLLLLGELEEAREVLEAALAEQEAMEVWDLGLMAWTLRNLARVYTDLGDGPRAEDMYRRLAELDQPWVH